MVKVSNVCVRAGAFRVKSFHAKQAKVQHVNPHETPDGILHLQRRAVPTRAEMPKVTVRATKVRHL